MAAEGPDVVCLQEIKLQAEHVEELDIAYPWQFWNHAVKAGYSGTAVFSKKEPKAVFYDFPSAFEQTEGRVVTVVFEDYAVVNVYTPNSKAELERLEYRQTVWDPAFCDYVAGLAQTQPVLLCGDLNVAHEPIDLARPEENRRSAGFTDEERDGFKKLLEAGFVDSFRYFYPELRNAYSWWSYRAGARQRNIGWRIDYVLASQTLLPRVQEAFIRPNVLGSDHCPVGVVLE